MDNPKYSVIYCSKCESDKINLDQMKCMNCGNPFTDDDIKALLDEAHEDYMLEKNDKRVMSKYSKEFVEECKQVYPNHIELHKCLDDNSYLVGQFLDDVKEQVASIKEVSRSSTPEEFDQSRAKMKQKIRLYSKWIREVERMEG